MSAAVGPSFRSNGRRANLERAAAGLILKQGLSDPRVNPRLPAHGADCYRDRIAGSKRETRRRESWLA
jgi:hypothetical protein